MLPRTNHFLPYTHNHIPTKTHRHRDGQTPLNTIYIASIARDPNSVLFIASASTHSRFQHSIHAEQPNDAFFTYYSYTQAHTHWLFHINSAVFLAH